MNDIQPKGRPADTSRPRFNRGAARPVHVRPVMGQSQPEVSPPPVSDIPLIQESPTFTEANSSLTIKPPKKPSSWKRWLIMTVLGLLLLTIIGIIGVYIWYQQNLQAVQSGSDEMVMVAIEPGTGPEGIATLLKDNDLIRSETAFGWYVRLEGKAGLLQAGSYRLGKGEDVPKIVEHLTSGNTDTFDITFLPGATLAEHRKVLIDAGYSEADIDKALNKTYENPIFADKPVAADLEGYIYGETYSFGANTTPEQILTYVFEHFEGIVEQENLVELYKQKGFTLYQGITLASVIQREVATPEDAAQVSQVFQSRLAAGMVLGSDVTYQYIADKEGNPRDVNYPSPYNTRINPGLPPGPISSPGLASLKAVAHPAPGDYLYFLSGDDDRTYFGRTNEEHEQNIREHCQKKCQII